jgi:hypothetical protein
MNTIAYPKSVKANITKYNKINSRTREVVARGLKLNKMEFYSINQGYMFGNSDLRLVLAGK